MPEENVFWEQAASRMCAVLHNHLEKRTPETLEEFHRLSHSMAPQTAKSLLISCSAVFEEEYRDAKSELDRLLDELCALDEQMGERETSFDSEAVDYCREAAIFGAVGRALDDIPEDGESDYMSLIELDPIAEVLGEVSDEEVREALEHMVAVANKVASRYLSNQIPAIVTASV